MDDRLKEVFKTLKLQASVFQAGALCQAIGYTPTESVGFIHILQSGDLEVRAPDGSLLVFDEPSLLIYMKSPEHHLKPVHQNVNIVCATFKFQSGFTNPLIASLPDFVQLPLKNIRGLDGILTAIYHESEVKDCGYSLILDQLMEVIFIHVVRYLMMQGFIESGMLAGLSDKRLAKAIQAIHENPSKSWSLEELSALAMMSRAKFSADFRNIVGMTPGAYATQWRLSIVQSLLLKGKSLEYISDEVGYANASALVRAFKSQFDQTPIQWLKLKMAEGQ